MLVDLSIHNFILLDRLDLSLAGGFTALTGETGSGKSIILDAISVALGGVAERRMIRSGADRAIVSAAFSVESGHPVWTALEDADLAVDQEELLTLKRVIPRKGAVRAYVNGQPVTAACLKEIGALLVEIHGQHAAMGLLRASSHRALLDSYAQNGALLEDCAHAWAAFTAAKEVHNTLVAAQRDHETQRDRLEQDLAALSEINAEAGECETLASEREILSHGQRLRDGLSEAMTALGEAGSRQGAALAARAVERLCRLPGLDDGSTGIAATFVQLRDCLERALIEMDEADGLLVSLMAELDCDDGRLEAVETRLFAIKGLARRFGVEADALPQLMEVLKKERANLEAGDDALRESAEREKAAKAHWRTVAARLTTARIAAAKRLGKAIGQEFKPLRMASTTLHVSIRQAAETAEGPHGQDTVEIEVETTKGAGFGPLAKIASGGELSRISLALRCALADIGEAPVLVFDEADQGAGGAVAAAIGERLSRLGAQRQVLAVTHSPQVAASADAQWRIQKRVGKTDAGRTCVAQLDGDARLDEVARMLSGHTVTTEARKAAARLLESSCQRQNP
ncbi:MAG: DNA repair protein RecN [Pseudomonadota bacterium]